MFYDLEIPTWKRPSPGDHKLKFEKPRVISKTRQFLDLKKYLPGFVLKEIGYKFLILKVSKKCLTILIFDKHEI